MKWSKLKYVTEDRFADAIKGRVKINSTAYGNCSCGHAWITLDKEVIANFCTRAYWKRKRYEKDKDRYIHIDVTENEIKRYPNQLVEYGDFSRQDFYTSCWTFIHDLTIEEALESNDILIQSLALMDKRIGKRRLSKITPEMLHSLPRKLFTVRMFTDNTFNNSPRVELKNNQHK